MDHRRVIRWYFCGMAMALSATFVAHSRSALALIFQAGQSTACNANETASSKLQPLLEPSPLFDLCYQSLIGFSEAGYPVDYSLCGASDIQVAAGKSAASIRQTMIQ